MTRQANGCPFHGGAQSKDEVKSLPTGKARIRLLYEEYIRLPALREVWDTPFTHPPVLEPCFAAGMHGIEIGFLLLANFVADSRSYVAKRPRIDRITDDITAQCKCLTDIIDGELEEEGVEGNRLQTLAQEFPFPGAPPAHGQPSRSPGLERLEVAVRNALPSLSTAERNSLIKVIINLTTIAFGSFQRWTVGLGIEPQLNSLREAVNLSPLPITHHHFLDYERLVRPKVVEGTTVDHHGIHYHEDFFFRSVHLGTECWAHIALQRLHSAKQFAERRMWHVAASRMNQAARILEYLGSHVMLLTTMNLRDYLYLKVELEGTSGEGSAQVKSLRPAIRELINPLKHAVIHDVMEKYQQGSEDWQDEEAQEGLLTVYEHPDEYRSLYNYAKALEDLESSLLGGFFFKHFCLAANVIGSDAKGTMKRAVQSLKTTYETPVFPILDKVRSTLGEIMDQELVQYKGRMMEDILKSYVRNQSRSFSSMESELLERRPFEKAVEQPVDSKPLASLYVADGFSAGLEARISKIGAALQLYAHPRQPLISFLDHAWGKVPPAALREALGDTEALFTLGNPSWQYLFENIVPQCSAHVCRLLGIPEDACNVHFGHNTHELVWRLLGSYVVGNPRGPRPLHVVTSDCEFYSVMRQLNRLESEGLVKVTVVDCEPVDDFAQRVLNLVSEGEVDVVYVSQMTYLTQTCLFPHPQDLSAFVVNVFEALMQNRDAKMPASKPPLVIIDGYHAFCALPISLTEEAAGKCCYIGGFLKHAGSGPNCAFLTIPRHLAISAIRPLFTGWIADPSVLLPISDGTHHGSPVLYDESLGLQGGTPAYFLPLLIFNRVMQLWETRTPKIDVQCIHHHVLALQHHFCSGLQSSFQDDGTVHGITMKSLINAKGPECSQSHTLVFAQPNSTVACDIVSRLKSHGILVDNRSRYVRIGFGPNHRISDVQPLLSALRSIGRLDGGAGGPYTE